MKALLLLKLERLDEAESGMACLVDPVNVLYNIYLPFVKFMKNDFSGAKKLLKD